MNEDLAVLAQGFSSVFGLMQTDFQMFGFDISLLDIFLTNAVIYMLLDIFLTYAGYYRNE